MTFTFPASYSKQITFRSPLNDLSIELWRVHNEMYNSFDSTTIGKETEKPSTLKSAALNILHSSNASDAASIPYPSSPDRSFQLVLHP